MLRRSFCILKNRPYLCILNILKLQTSASPILCSRFDKNLPVPNVPTPVSKMYGPETDILLEELKKCKSLDRTLELMNMHLDVMNSKHIVTCLENIHDYIKNDKKVAESLLENHIFKSFSARLMKVIRLFDPQEVLTTYKVFCSLELRSNTYVMQSILKMLGGHLNNMSLGQLTFLNFLLCKQRHNALVDGLRLALPLVLQVQIDQQLDSDNLTEVVSCLQLSCRSALKPATIQKIVNVILRKASMLSTDDAITVIFSLLSIDVPIDGYSELINFAFDVVSNNIEDIRPTKLCTILKTCRYQRFYHTKFFFRVAELIVSQKWNLSFTYTAISHFFPLRFAPSILLDHFAEVLCLESKVYQDDNFYSPINCIEYLTATSYRPARIDEAARVLYSDYKKVEDLRRKTLYLYIKFHTCLAMLGHFPCESLSKILDEESLSSAWSLSRKSGKTATFEQCILTLFWSLKLHDETRNFTVSPAVLRKIFNLVYQRNLNAEYPLKKFIENGLGGPQFLQSGVCTEDGHIIDHIVAMRSGNYPVSLHNLKSNRKEKSMEHVTFVEDILLPDDAKIIAVIVANEDDYFRDPEIVRGSVDLKIRSLESKKYKVVVVNYNVWTNLPDREKIPYLMREIKQVIPNDCAARCNYS